MSLTGKIAVVTGGSRGIGRAICQQLGALGATVIVNYVSNPTAADETVKSIADNGGTAETVQFNVGVGAEIEAAFKKILADHGRVDILLQDHLGPLGAFPLSACHFCLLLGG